MAAHSVIRAEDETVVLICCESDIEVTLVSFFAEPSELGGQRTLASSGNRRVKPGG